MGGADRPLESVVVNAVLAVNGRVHPAGRFDTSGRDALVRELRAGGATIRGIAADVGVSVGTVHRILHPPEPKPVVPRSARPVTLGPFRFRRNPGLESLVLTFTADDGATVHTSAGFNVDPAGRAEAAAVLREIADDLDP